MVADAIGDGADGLFGDEADGLIGDNAVGVFGDGADGVFGDGADGLVGDEADGVIGDNAVGVVGDTSNVPAHSVYPKQDMSSRQSSESPLGQGCAQEEFASQIELPQKKVSGFCIEQVVCAKQAWPTGHSVDDRLGQGMVQPVAASSKLKPQKKESSGALVGSAVNGGTPSSTHVVYLWQVADPGHSESKPEGQALLQFLEASSKFAPQ